MTCEKQRIYEEKTFCTILYNINIMFMIVIFALLFPSKLLCYSDYESLELSGKFEHFPKDRMGQLADWHVSYMKRVIA